MQHNRSETFGQKPWWVAFVCGMASYIDAAAIVSSGTALVLYQQDGIVSEGEIGILSGALTLCIALGALSGGRLGDRFGRRKIFVITMAVVIVGALTLIFGSSFPTLLAGMILVGLGSGADLPVSLATISEAAADNNRGKLIGFSHVLWYAGIIGANAFGAIVGDMGRIGGQIMFTHILVASAIILALRITIPESVSWSTAVSERRAGLQTIRARTTGLSALLNNRELLVTAIALFIFYSLTNLGANTNNQFGTYIAVNVIGISVQLQSVIAICSLFLGIFGAMIFMRLVDTPLRMKLYLIGAAMLVIGYLIPVALGFSLAAWIALKLLTTIGGAFAFETIMKVWTQESFPTLLRSTVQGAVIAGARIVAAGVAIVTPTLMHTPKLAYSLIAAVVAAGLLVGWLFFRRPRFNAFQEEGQRSQDSAFTDESPSTNLNQNNPSASA